jgi:hypothetical protein
MVRQRALVVCLVAVAAGCGSALFADSAPAPRETATPVSLTPAGTATPGPSLPPGVSDGGALQTARLQRAHDATLANTTYTLVITQRITLSGTTTSTQRALSRVAVGETATLATIRRSNGGVNRSLYLTGSEGYQRSVTGGNTTVTAVDPTDESLEVFGTRPIQWYLSDVEFAATAVERDGTRLYRLYSPPGRAPAAVTTDPRVKANVWNYTATAYVTPAGFVRTVAVDYELTSRPVRGSVSLRIEYTAVGETTVSRPEWVPTPSRRTATPSSTPKLGTPGTSTTAGPNASGTSTTAEP